MPTPAPTVLKAMAEIENTLACHSMGTKLPIVEPTNIPNHTSFLFTQASVRPRE